MADKDGASTQKAVNDDELDALKVWVLKAIRFDVTDSKLKGNYFVDTDAYSFVKYVAALLKQDKPFEELKELCVRNLKLFTQQDTQRFVDHLFSALQGKHFLKIQQDPEYNELYHYVLVKENRLEEQPTSVDDNKPSHSGADLNSTSEGGGAVAANASSPHHAHSRRSNSRSRSRSGSRERLSVRDRLGWRRSRERGNDDGENDNASTLTGGENRDSRQTINNRRRDNNRDYVSNSNNNARRHHRDGGFDNNNNSRSARRDYNPNSNIRSLQSTVMVVDSESTSFDGLKTNDNVLKQPTAQPVNASNSQQQQIGPSSAKQRCRDFEEKGFCVRGDACPFDHGSNPVIIDDKNLHDAVRFVAAPLNIHQQSSGAPRHQQPAGGAVSAGAVPAVGPTTGIAITIGNLPQSQQKQTGLVTVPANVGPAQQHPSMVQLGSVTQPMSANIVNPASFQQQQRALGGFAMANTAQGMQNIQTNMPVNSLMQPQQMMRPANMISNIITPVQGTPVGMMTVHYQQQQQPMVQHQGHFMQRPMHMSNNMRRFPQHGYQPRGVRPMMNPQQQHHQNFGSGVVNPCAIELRKIPRENNNILKLSEHFGKYGNIVNIKLHYDNDESAALLEFEKPEEACAAFQSPEPIMQNRFVRIFWLRDRSLPMQQALSTDAAGGGRISAKSRLGNRVSAKDRLGNNNAGVSTSGSRDTLSELSSVAGRKRKLEKDTENEAGEPLTSVIRTADVNDENTDADDDMTNRDELVVSPTPEQEERNSNPTSSSSGGKTSGGPLKSAGFLPNMTIRVGGGINAGTPPSTTATPGTGPQRGGVAIRRSNFYRGGISRGSTRPSVYAGNEASSYGDYSAGPPASFYNQYYYVPTLDEVRHEHEQKQQEVNDFDTAIKTKEAHLEQENALFTTIIHQFKGCRAKLQQQMLEETRVELLEMQQRTKESLDECSRRKDALQQEIDQIRKRKEWSLQELSYLTVQTEMQQELSNCEEECNQLRSQIAAAEEAGGDSTTDVLSAVEQLKEKELALHHLHTKLQKHMYAKGKMHRLVQEVARNMASGRRIEGPRGGGVVGGPTGMRGARGGRGGRGAGGAPAGDRSLYRKVNTGAMGVASSIADNSNSTASIASSGGSNHNAAQQQYQHLLHQQQQQQQQQQQAQHELPHDSQQWRELVQEYKNIDEEEQRRQAAAEEEDDEDDGEDVDVAVEDEGEPLRRALDTGLDLSTAELPTDDTTHRRKLLSMTTGSVEDDAEVNDEMEEEGVGAVDDDDE